jgi:hypothetical protein
MWQEISKLPISQPSKHFEKMLVLRKYFEIAKQIIQD